MPVRSIEYEKITNSGKYDSIGEVQLFSDDEKAGKIDISVSDGKLRVYHTEVDTEYKGKGFAKLLLMLSQLVSFL
jgi:predicted GNAT family acetyltransferase